MVVVYLCWPTAPFLDLNSFQQEGRKEVNLRHFGTSHTIVKHFPSLNGHHMIRYLIQVIFSALFRSPSPALTPSHHTSKCACEMRLTDDMHIRISGDSACESQMEKLESGSVRALQAILPARMETSHEQCVTFKVKPSYTLVLRPTRGLTLKDFLVSKRAVAMTPSLIALPQKDRD